MTLLVFGHSGQVATELRRQTDVLALSREQADLTDPERCAAWIREIKPRAVINAAAYTAVDAAEDNEDLAMVINGVAPGAMACAAAELEIPFLHISTDYVFNGNGQKSWKPDDEPAPIGAYGRSKLLGEEKVRQAGGQYIVLRTSWVFSAHGSNFVKSMLRLSKTQDSLSIVADQFGGPTAAADIAATLLTIFSQIEAGNTSEGVYHYAGTPKTNWADFARAIFALSGRNVEVNDITSEDFPTPAKRPANSVLDCATLLRDFGIEQPDWMAGLSTVLAQLKNEDSI